MSRRRSKISFRSSLLRSERFAMSVVSDEGVSSWRLREYTSCERNCAAAATPRKSATTAIAIAPVFVRIKPPRSVRLGEPDVERAAERGHVDRARPGHAEAQALDITTLLDVLQLGGIVERAEEAVLGTDRGDVERRRHERAVHHDRGADAIDARRAHDALIVDRDRVGPALPGGVDDVGEVGRVTDRLIDVACRHADVAGVVELDDDAIAGAWGQAGASQQVVDPRLELALRAGLRRGVALDLVKARPETGELGLQPVLLVLQGVRRVDERRVVANAELAPLGLRPPLERHEEPEEDGRKEQNERPANAARPEWRSGGGHRSSLPLEELNRRPRVWGIARPDNGTRWGCSAGDRAGPS